MIYVAVLFGSLFVILCILGMRIALRARSVRKFVRGVKQRIDNAEDRGARLIEETVIEQPRKNPRASAIDMQKVRTLTREADKVIARGKLEEAEKLYIQSLTLRPDAHDIRAALAKLYLKRNLDQKAEAMYRELLKDHDDVSFHANLGLSYYRQGKYTESCQCYQAALDRDPKNPERMATLGRACIAGQYFREAAPLLEKASTFLTRDTELLSLLAKSYLALGEKAEAKHALERINKIEPYNEEVKAKLKELEETVEQAISN